MPCCRHSHQLQTLHNLCADPLKGPKNCQGWIRSSYICSQTCRPQAHCWVLQALKEAKTQPPKQPLPLPQALLLLMANLSRLFSKQHNQMSLSTAQLIFNRFMQRHWLSHILSLYSPSLWLKLRQCHSL